MAKKDTNNGGGRLAVLTYASELGYEDVVERGKWNGATAYELVLKKDSGEVYTGMPQYILDDGEGGLSIAGPDEAFAILDSLDEEDGDDV